MSRVPASKPPITPAGLRARDPAKTPAAPSPVPMPYPTNFLKEEHGQTLSKSHGKALRDHGKGLVSAGAGLKSPPQSGSASPGTSR